MKKYVMLLLIGALSLANSQQIHEGFNRESPFIYWGMHIILVLIILSLAVSVRKKVSLIELGIMVIVYIFSWFNIPFAYLIIFVVTTLMLYDTKKKK